MSGIPHAAIRARERYGINLSLFDIIDLAKRCYAGEGLVETIKRDRQVHALVFKERVIWLVYIHPSSGRSRHKHGTVLTIMPPQIATGRCYRDGQQKWRRLEHRR